MFTIPRLRLQIRGREAAVRCGVYCCVRVLHGGWRVIAVKCPGFELERWLQCYVCCRTASTTVPLLLSHLLPLMTKYHILTMYRVAPGSTIAAILEQANHLSVLCAESSHNFVHTFWPSDICLLISVQSIAHRTTNGYGHHDCTAVLS